MTRTKKKEEKRRRKKFEIRNRLKKPKSGLVSLHLRLLSIRGFFLRNRETFYFPYIEIRVINGGNLTSATQCVAFLLFFFSLNHNLDDINCFIKIKFSSSSILPFFLLSSTKTSFEYIAQRAIMPLFYNSAISRERIIEISHRTLTFKAREKYSCEKMLFSRFIVNANVKINKH